MTPSSDGRKHRTSDETSDRREGEGCEDCDEAEEGRSIESAFAQKGAC
jgi:hypothetical protein